MLNITYDLVKYKHLCKYTACVHTTYENRRIFTHLIPSSISLLWSAVGGDEGEGKDERKKKRKRTKKSEVEVERSPSKDEAKVGSRTISWSTPTSSHSQCVDSCVSNPPMLRNVVMRVCGSCKMWGVWTW